MGIALFLLGLVPSYFVVVMGIFSGNLIGLAIFMPLGLLLFVFFIISACRFTHRHHFIVVQYTLASCFVVLVLALGYIMFTRRA